MNNATISAEKLRPALLNKIQGMNDEDLSVLEMVMLRLERDRAFQSLTNGFAEDRRQGKYERLDEIIGEARAASRAA